MSTQHYPICMAEEYWANSYFSVARYYGGIQMNQYSYKIVNKEGITIFELSDPENEHYVGDGDEQAIKPGEPADLVREDWIPIYRALGRDKFLEYLKAHPNTNFKEAEEHAESLGLYTSEGYKKTKKKKVLSKYLMSKYKGSTDCVNCDCRNYPTSECERHFLIEHGASCKKIDLLLMKNNKKKK